MSQKPSGGAKRSQDRVLIRNRKARHDFEIDEEVEAGMSLLGSEVKSLRLGNASITDGFAAVRGGELFLEGVQIDPYDKSNQFNHDPFRSRKLLVHREQIDRLAIKTTERGYTLIPLELTLKGGRMKVILGLGRGKKLWDKRQSKKEQDIAREVAQELSEHKR